jgi:hypothetical protein
LVPSPSTVEAPLPVKTEANPDPYPLALPLQWLEPVVVRAERCQS